MQKQLVTSTPTQSLIQHSKTTIITSISQILIKFDTTCQQNSIMALAPRCEGRLILHFSSSLLLLLHLLCLGNCSEVRITSLPCNGSLAECDPEEDLEMAMESETLRRFLEGGGKSIGYDALHKDRPAFGGGNGQPYSKSLPANSYNRDCEKIYKCRK